MRAVRRELAYGEQPLTERLDCNVRRGTHVSSRGQWLSGAEDMDLHTDTGYG